MSPSGSAPVQDGEEFGVPSSGQMGIIGKLLGATFPGSEVLLDQARTLRVRSIDNDGSFKLLVARGKPAEVVRRIPVEAEMTDVDGVQIHVLLHVVEGYLDELEVYRDDSERPMADVHADALRVMVF